MKKIGLFFGSFNPIHNGHLGVAHAVLEETECEEVWLVVSPQNPFKSSSTLLRKESRLQIIDKALAGERAVRSCSIEFDMPVPSYTVDTLEVLSGKYPGYEFFLIMGADNLEGFVRWKRWQDIVSRHAIIVYPRNGVVGSVSSPVAYKLISAPEIEISSSEIRRKIRAGEPVDAYLPSSIVSEILETYR